MERRSPLLGSMALGAALVLAGCVPEPRLVPPINASLTIDEITLVERRPGARLYEVAFTLSNLDDWDHCYHVSQRVTGEAMDAPRAADQVGDYLLIEVRPSDPETETLEVDPVWAFEDSRELTAKIRVDQGTSISGTTRFFLGEHAEELSIYLADSSLGGITWSVAECGLGSARRATSVRVQSDAVALPD